MNTYGVITITNKEKYATFIGNLNIYHGRAFPLQKKDQIYKIINSDLCIVRAGEHWSTGDILGNLTVGINLAEEDRFYCFPLGKCFPIRLNNHYFHDSLDELSLRSYKEQLSFKQTTGILYLANYLYMLENDNNETGRISVDGNSYIISDRFQHWVSKKKYRLRVDLSPRYQGRGRIVESYVNFGRFSYYDIEEWMSKAAEVLGFDLLYYRDGKMVDDVHADNFNETELVFSGSHGWKENLNFSIDGNIGGRTVSFESEVTEWEKITRKPYNVIHPNIRFDSLYENMLDDVKST